MNIRLLPPFLPLLLVLGGCLRQPETDRARNVPVVAPEGVATTPEGYIAQENAAGNPEAPATPKGEVGPAASDPNRPNVLMILFDDLNDWVGPLEGHPDVKTPHLDRLAKKGLVFTNAHTDAPACNPARTALLSGLRPTTTGVYFNGQPYLSALPGSFTLLEYFSAHGYRTLGAGKIFHTFGSGKLVWDEYYDKMKDPEPEVEHEDRLFKEKHFDWGPVDAPIKDMADTKIAKAAAKWLSKPSDRPFFLAVGFHRPHLPWHVPQQFFDEYTQGKKGKRAAVSLPQGYQAGDLADIPRMGRRLARTEEHRQIQQAKAWNEAVHSYLASVSFVDTVLSVIVKALDRGPHKDNTIIVITSDHGFHLGEKNHWGKYSLWRQATRVPLIIVAPGMKAKGKSTVRPATLVDIYPTLIELCGLTPARNLDGVSLAPLLDRPSQPWPHPAITTHRSGNNSIRYENWTFIRYHDGTEELYNTKLDPYEWNNLVGQPDSDRHIRRLARKIPEPQAPNAPFAFNPRDLKTTTKNLLRFFPAEKLQGEIERQSARRAKARADEDDGNQ